MKMKTKDINHLEWVYERMEFVHNENENFDYMIKFREIIASLKVAEAKQLPTNNVTEGEEMAKKEFPDETGTFLEMPNQSKVILQRRAFIKGLSLSSPEKQEDAVDYKRVWELAKKEIARLEKSIWLNSNANEQLESEREMNAKLTAELEKQEAKQLPVVTDIEDALPKTFFAGLSILERVKMLSKHWNRAIVTIQKLEAKQIER